MCRRTPFKVFVSRNTVWRILLVYHQDKVFLKGFARTSTALRGRYVVICQCWGGETLLKNLRLARAQVASSALLGRCSLLVWVAKLLNSLW